MSVQLLPLRENHFDKFELEENLNLFKNFKLKIIEKNKNWFYGNKSEIEFELAICDEINDIDRRFDIFDLLEIINKKINNQDYFRCRDVCTRPDENNRFVMYPNHNFINNQLKLINEKYFFSNSPCVLNAIAIYIGILHVHPLIDGNGRAARIIFNYYLLKFIGNVEYINIKKLNLKFDCIYKYSINLFEIFGVENFVLIYFSILFGSVVSFDDHLIDMVEKYLDNSAFYSVFPDFDCRSIFLITKF